MESVAAVDLELVGVVNGGDGGRVDGGQSDRVHANVHPRWWCGRRWTFASIAAANVQPWFPAGRRWTFASIVAANIHRGSQTRSRRTFADRARSRSLGSVSLALPRRDSTTSIAALSAARLAGVQSAVHAGVVGVCGGRVRHDHRQPWSAKEFATAPRKPLSHHHLMANLQDGPLVGRRQGATSSLRERVDRGAGRVAEVGAGLGVVEEVG